MAGAREGWGAGAGEKSRIRIEAHVEQRRTSWGREAGEAEAEEAKDVEAGKAGMAVPMRESEG